MPLKRIQLILVLLCTASLAWAQSDTTIVIKAIAGLQYDPPRIQVRPNTQVTFILENYDDMAHNLVITKAGMRKTVVEQALKVPSEKNYVPETPMVIAATKIVAPGNSEKITFTVGEGVYSYVCTYPGHGFVMYGALYARDAKLPPLELDPHVAQIVKDKVAGQQVGPHAFPLEYPLLYRTWVSGASPAAIVVSFDGNSSYCWDAGQCRLRYAWTGGFVDNSEQWYSKGDKFTKIIGDVYWKEDSLNYPIRVGTPEHIPVVKFLGYKLKDRLPTFRYLVDGIEIHETLRVLPGEIGITRDFLVIKNPAQKKIYYKTGTYQQTTYQPKFLKADPSSREVYVLNPGSAKFSVTIKPNS
ncbi:hypothetical protein BWI96_18430 [Siphonobacter sp. SORGH_AS_0500]|uniref:plastocyanin/azurin family copper-binding protein n=1 Tax=Siphonobacter sp. SORGH_AS_0500 TaxID=1864824 RepID=UPI000CB20282|nr:plastocyanin/azurin family copper-binding protein [Siphonobacter sp. SORGH_AS_0500]PKK35185.1 hypothetical protein BWI96_18430 [Siphonobacter sp. SORGH_AS_0500]